MKTKVWNIGDRVTQIRRHYKGVSATVIQVPTIYGRTRIHVANDAQPGDSDTFVMIRLAHPNNLKKI